MTSNQAPGPGQSDQMASWDHFIKRDLLENNEEWYFDFLVDAPAGHTTGTFGEYLGFIGYGDTRLEIYAKGYKLWDDYNQTYITTAVTGSTTGQRNIGFHLGSGSNTGVWVDGSLLWSNLGPHGDSKLRFGSHLLDDDTTGWSPTLAGCACRAAGRAASSCRPGVLLA